MPAYICLTCGIQHAESPDPPSACRICEDERQYVGFSGQQWTTLDALAETHEIHIDPLEESLRAVEMRPSFAIGQRALLVQHPGGNLLWDCLSLVDQPGVDRIAELGGLAGIAISHPHYYGVMVEWSRAFDAPVYLHADHRPWVMRPDDAIVYWDEEARTIVPGVTAIRCGGHFPGSSVLHWADGAEGRGALFTGDTIYVVSDRRWVSFMYSYPNLIPLDAATVLRIVAAVEPFTFDRLHSSWRDSVVARDAKGAVRRSAERYIAHISG